MSADPNTSNISREGSERVDTAAQSDRANTISSLDLNEISSENPQGGQDDESGPSANQYLGRIPAAIGNPSAPSSSTTQESLSRLNLRDSSQGNPMVLLKALRPWSNLERAALACCIFNDKDVDTIVREVHRLGSVTRETPHSAKSCLAQWMRISESLRGEIAIYTQLELTEEQIAWVFLRRLISIEERQMGEIDFPGRPIRNLVQNNAVGYDTFPNPFVSGPPPEVRQGTLPSAGAPGDGGQLAALTSLLATAQRAETESTTPIDGESESE